MPQQSVDKTVFVYIAVAWYDSPAKINVEGRNTTWAYIIPVRRNNLGAELFLQVGIGKNDKFRSTSMEATIEVKDYVRHRQQRKSRGVKPGHQPGPR